MAGRLGPSGWTARGRVLVPGTAHADALVLSEPLSMWGGLDVVAGRITDAHHPQHGAVVAGCALVLPAGRGSSSSSSVLAESLRRGTGPRAILLGTADEIIVLGVLVAQLLYERVCPVVALEPPDYSRLKSGDRVSIDDGLVRVSRALD